MAIEVLPPQCVADAGWTARFAKEAKAASALNQLNIVVTQGELVKVLGFGLSRLDSGSASLPGVMLTPRTHQCFV